MSTLLNDLTFAHDDNLVGSDNGAQPVSNNYHRLLALLEQLIQCLLHLVLTLGIQGTCGLVQKQDAWFADKSSRDSNALLLSAREAATPFTNLGLKAFFKLRSVIEEPAAGLFQSSLQSTFDLFIRHAGSVKAIENVISNRCGEEAGFLLNDSQLLLVIPPHIDLLNVLPVKEDLTAKRIVETFYQGDDRRLAAARSADESHSLAVLNINIDAFEHRHIRLRGIVELDVLDLNGALLDITERFRYFLMVVIAELLLLFGHKACNLIE